MDETVEDLSIDREAKEPFDTEARDERSRALREKRDAIEKACQQNDVKALVGYATSSGGLLDDTLRQVAWPILLGGDQSKTSPQTIEWTGLPHHGDEGQVKLDVDRSFVYYPQDEGEELAKRKKQLSNLITETLRRHPMLCYFQGYHDIAQVLLLVLGPQIARNVCARVSLLRIRDYMLPSLTPAFKHLNLIPAILESVDSRVRRHLSGTQPFFALAAALTLYAHDIEEYDDIVRLYDFLLAHEPVVAIYLFAAIVLKRKKELLDIPIDEPEMIHFTLSKLPNPLDLEGLIASTLELYEQHPPESLPLWAWRQIPYNSVLKTSRNVGQAVSLDEATELFVSQAKQLQREESRKKIYAALWRYRRPAGSLGLALMVGLGDLGHTDLQEDLEFHPSNFENDARTAKIQADSQPFLGGNGSGGGGSSRDGGRSGDGKHRLWTIQYYSQYFDVDTNEVLRRCVAAIYPRSNFLDILDGNPDLYGPFWIATTVVIILFLTGTISQYLSREHDKHFEYDFRLLSGAAGLIYGYTGVIPIALWAALRWFGSSTADLIECWALYGYANLMWIAVALVSWSPLTALNWALVGVGFASTVFFLLRNLYPVLSATDAKTSKMLLIAVVVLHAGLAIAIKVLFFAHGSPVSKKNHDDDDDKHDDDHDDDHKDDDKGRMLF
ncbi:Protein YIP5 [Talaromyces islandicus]|uniref:Protein YIP5 n=1 Tax=Talaromyces islandicus TaxID=28573 RepID=A0A0U1M5Q1_TALIS|nr:Protein YIP5 [Talaromyces islandicus]